MTLLSSIYARKLSAQTRCPVCGAKRSELLDKPPIGIASYECSAAFSVCGEQEIFPHTICPAASHLAARQLNAEARAEAEKAGEA